MIKEAKVMMCGNCGKHKFRVYDADIKDRLFVECVKCGSTSILISHATLNAEPLRYGDDTDAAICIDPNPDKDKPKKSGKATVVVEDEYVEASKSMLGDLLPARDDKTVVNDLIDHLRLKIKGMMDSISSVQPSYSREEILLPMNSVINVIGALKDRNLNDPDFVAFSNRKIEEAMRLGYGAAQDLDRRQ